MMSLDTQALEVSIKFPTGLAAKSKTELGYVPINASGLIGRAFSPKRKIGQDVPRAFYYIRLIKIPAPRWTAHEQKQFGDKLSDYVPMTVTESRVHIADLVHPGQ